ncbi:MAG: lipoprotein signal peptidase [Bacteroidales bacterium]|jgi:signal peptidase II|nr:lipoprotein signal peptidase [Bacteroidales bacterium]MDD3272592.1 lipoprotein signal peptidase [Bacteroidales bacterium]MDD4057423.1 lipoprotein signal peptidase [Bacteroidales bacterium]
MRLTPGKQVTLIVFILLLIDQVVKIWIKTHMTIGESIPVFGSWFQIYFIENNGMAFGMQFGGTVGKFLLTALRLVLIGVIIYYLRRLVKEGASRAFLTGISLILVGAIGNVIDSMFYGLIFSESTFTQLATIFPEGGGYAPFMFGKVVDMLYFPMIDIVLPDWVPFRGGEQFIFFRPIFNIADSCITIGVFFLLLFRRKELMHALK